MNSGNLTLTRDNVTIDGQFTLVLLFARARPGQGFHCGPDAFPSEPEDAAIVMDAHGGEVRFLAVRYFPNGIRIQSGSGNQVRQVDERYICDDAVDTRSYYEGDPLPTKGLPTATIFDSIFEGYTIPTAGFTCHDDNIGLTAPCGLDKALQINSGVVTIFNNDINRIRNPVRICGRDSIAGSGCSTPTQTLRVHGPHRIEGNRTTGLLPGNPQCVYADNNSNGTPDSCENLLTTDNNPSDNFSPLACRNICRGYRFADSGDLGPGVVNEFIGNTVSYCHQAVQVESRARVRIDGNTFKANYGAAVAVSNTEAGVLAENNVFVLNGCIATDKPSGGQVVSGDFPFGPVEDLDPRSYIDFGRGGNTYKSAFDPSFNCAWANRNAPNYQSMCSDGRNKFCRDPNRPGDFDVLNTDTDGTAVSFGIGSPATAGDTGCFGNVGSTSVVSGRVRTRQTPSGDIGSRCGDTQLAFGIQTCTPPGPTSCNCSNVFP